MRAVKYKLLLGVSAATDILLVCVTRTIELQEALRVVLREEACEVQPLEIQLMQIA